MDAGQDFRFGSLLKYQVGRIAYFP